MLNYASSIVIADIEVYYNITLMYVYNVYQGISFLPQFPDERCRGNHQGYGLVCPVVGA